MTIRIIPLIGALLATLVAAPSIAQESVAPHSLDFDSAIEPEGIVIQDLSGGVGSQDTGGGGGSMIQILQLQPGTTNGVSTSTSAPRYSGTVATGRAR